jgi:hypothetical protein
VSQKISRSPTKSTCSHRAARLSQRPWVRKLPKRDLFQFYVIFRQEFFFFFSYRMPLHVRRPSSSMQTCRPPRPPSACMLSGPYMLGMNICTVRCRRQIGNKGFRIYTLHIHFFIQGCPGRETNKNVGSGLPLCLSGRDPPMVCGRDFRI